MIGRGAIALGALTASLFLTATRGDAAAAAEVSLWIYPCASSREAPVVKITDYATDTSSSPKVRSAGSAWATQAALKGGYYGLSASSNGCSSNRSVAIVGGVARQIALIEVKKGTHPTDAGGAIAGTLPLEGTRVLITRHGETSGDHADVEGSHFYGEGFAPGAYDVYLEFAGCCFAMHQTHVYPNRVAILKFSTADYYTQAFDRKNKGATLGRLVVDPESHPWFEESLGLETRIGTLNGIGRLTEYKVASTAIYFNDITPDGRGNIWLASRSGDLAKLTRSGQLSHFPAHNVASLVVAPDGTLWGLDSAGISAIHLDPQTGTFNTYGVGAGDSGGSPGQLAIGIDGTVLTNTPGLSVVAAVSPDGQVTKRSIGWICGVRSPLAWGSGFMVSCNLGSPRAFIIDAHLKTITPLRFADDAPSAPPGVLCAGEIWFETPGKQRFIGLDATGKTQELSYAGNGVSVTCSGESLWTLEHSDSEENVAVRVGLDGSSNRYRLPDSSPKSYGPVESLVPDSAGNVWFTVPGRLCVYRLSPKGDLHAFVLRPKPVRAPW